MTEENTDRSQEVIKAYLDFVDKNKRIPTQLDLHNEGITREVVRHHFGSLTQLHKTIDEDHHDQIDKLITSEKHVFSKKNMQQLQAAVGNRKRFVITSAVSGKKLHHDFFNAIQNYCSLNDAILLIIPCNDVASTRRSVSPWVFDPALKKDNVIFITEESRLNDSLFISSIKVSAKAIQPTTGLSRIGQRNGSYIFASPKQFLEFVATSPSKSKMPKAIMTTGAITVADYHTDLYMSQRTSYIAESDHVMGALIVEIEDENVFHFRQIQMSTDGSFIDLGTRYNPDQTVNKEKADFYAGDWHSGQTDDMIVDSAMEFCSELNVGDFYVGDFFDGYSISHHHVGLPLKAARKARYGTDYLAAELTRGSVDMSKILSSITGNLFLIKGNHDEVLERYLLQSRYVDDPVNHYDALDMARDLLDGKNPLEEAYKRHSDPDSVDWDRVVFIPRDEEHRIGGVEVGQHGDKGSNGSAGTLLALEKAYGQCIVGHSHVAAILRGVFRVGTFTKLQLEYNDGPSSWTHTGCLIYADGSRQLINFIKTSNGVDYRIR